MDLTLPIGDMVLNMRVALIVKTKDGFIFEKHKSGYYFVIGGRIKAGESSGAALKREVYEELSVSISNFRLKAIIENFYVSRDKKVHEICFVYQTEDVLEKELSSEFFMYPQAEIQDIDIQPRVMKEVIISESKQILHLITNNNA
jgi:8-oxo-dGTP pyrophosphatase MutT (NUDIX family)